MELLLLLLLLSSQDGGETGQAANGRGSGKVWSEARADNVGAD